MSVNDSLPHGGRTWCPWPHDPPEGWPYEYVARVDYDALAARLADSQDECRSFKARLAEADRNEGTLLGMIRHQRDVLRECLPYLNESMAGRRPGRSADDIRAAVKALITDSASVGQETKDA